MDCNQSRMFPTLATLDAPKSGTPDFGVKLGNDGGNRGTSVLHPFDRDLLSLISALSFRPLDPLLDHPLGFNGVAPVLDLHPFSGFEVLVVGKEVLDLH